MADVTYVDALDLAIQALQRAAHQSGNILDVLNYIDTALLKCGVAIYLIDGGQSGDLLLKFRTGSDMASLKEKVMATL
jgi:hypothetical protein